MSYLQVDRRVGEWVDILDDRTGETVASVRVDDIHGKRARLGFRADKHIRFVRPDAKVKVPRTNSENGNGNTQDSSK